MTRTTTRIAGAIALALIGAALAASPALAERPDDRAQRTLGSPGPNWEQALQARSEAMNRYHGLGVGAATIAATTSAAPLPASAASADGFAWDDASVGAGAVLAAFLLVGGVAVSVRHRGRVSTT